MGGDAENPYQILSSDGHRRRRDHFPVGSLVEVRTNEEGLEGAYFSATVIPPSAPNSLQKKSRKLVYVEYDNLLATEEGSERLREYVDVSCVRPAAPALQEEEEADRVFKPDDVVDAFYMDGWWTGLVSRVVEGGERVAVAFQNPPHELEFGVSDVRAHWDWVNGMWVKQQSAGFILLMFGVGRMVEISLQGGGCYRDAWIPTIIHQYLGNGVLLVEYDIGKKDVKTKVDLHNVRPCPPVFVDDDQRKFVLLERVDAYFDFAWRSGVITKELEDNRYIVFFKQIKQHKEFDRWNLRPHMEWKDGRWLLPSSFSDDGVGDQDFSVSAADNQNMSSTRRRHHPSDSGTALKKLKEGNAKQDRHGQPIEQVLCGCVKNMETSAAVEISGDQSSCEKKIVRERESVHAKRNVDKGKKIKRALPRLDQEKVLQESKNRSLERETVQSTSGEIVAVHVQDLLGGNIMQVNRVDEEFDDEQPILKWIEPEEIQHSPSIIDDSRLSSVGIVQQCRVDGEKQRDGYRVPLLKWIETEEMQHSPSVIDGSRLSQVSNVEQCMRDGEKHRDGDELPLLKWTETEEMQHSPSVIDGSRLSPVSNVEQYMVDGDQQRDVDELPLLKWTEPEEMQHSPSVIDGLRLSPISNVEQCTTDGEKHRDGVVLDDELPLLTWTELEEMQHRSSVIDGSRLSPVGNVEQFMADGEKQRDGVVFNDEQLGVVLDDEDSGRQAAYALVDRGSIVPNDLELLVKDSEKQQQGSGTQANLALEDICCLVPSEEPQSLPFVKNTHTASLWENIESMRVLQRIPQKPHFQPLKHIKESLREGFAIGYMVSFACLVEKACGLQLNDPKSIIDEIMESFAEMERHGFDVSLVRGRLTKLLDLKAEHEKLVDEVNNFNNHVQEHNHEKTRIEEEIQEMNEKISKLQEELSLAESAKEKEDDEIASLQTALKETEESLKIVESDIEGIISSIL